MRLMAVAALVALFAIPLSANALSTQEQPRFGENVEVNVVLIDALVTDNKGNQILGLDKGDFIVTENGVAQTIDSVDYYTNRKLLTAREENAPFKAERARDNRYFVFFFDKPNDVSLWSDVTMARNAAKDFVRSQLRPGDQVAVVGHDVRLKVYSDFTSDKQQILDGLDAAALFGKGVTSGTGPLLSAMNTSEMINGTGTVYEALETLGNALKPIQSRKELLLFSPGIFEPGQTVQNGIILTQSRYYDPMIHALNAANVSVYAANLMTENTLHDIPAVHQTLEQLAADTGGEYVRHVTSFGPFIKRVEQKNSGYYLITYRAHHPKGTSGFQRVEVKTKASELHVKARPGYIYGQLTQCRTSTRFEQHMLTRRELA